MEFQNYSKINEQIRSYVLFTEYKNNQKVFHIQRKISFLTRFFIEVYFFR